MRRPSGLTRSSGSACSEGTVAAPGVPRVTDAVGSVLTAGLPACFQVVVGTGVYLSALLRTERVPSCRLTFLDGSDVPSEQCFFSLYDGYIGLSHPLKGTCTWVVLPEVIWFLGVRVLPATFPIVMVFRMWVPCFTDCRAALGLSGQI